MNAAVPSTPQATATDGEEPFEPREAAIILQRTQRSARHQLGHESPLLSLAYALVMVAVYLFDGAVRYDGFGNSIVYGVFDAAAPWAGCLLFLGQAGVRLRTAPRG